MRSKPATPRVRRPLLIAGLAGGTSTLAVAMLAAQFGTRDGAATAQPLAVAAAAPANAAEPAAPAVADAPVRWQDGDLLINLHQVPLAQAMTLLAGATRSTLSGAERLPPGTPVSLHTRVGQAADAWQQLLQGHAAFSVNCGAASCHVWITGAVAPPVAAAATPDAPRPPLPGSAAPQDPAAENESQPDGSC